MSSVAIHNPVSQWDDQELVKAIKDTVCKGATDSQFRMFAEVCKATGLNPWLREIWFVPNVGVMAGRDGYLRIANDHPQFDGMSTVVERDDQGIPIKATCSVWRKDRAHPITCEAFYNEYRKSSQVWQTYKSAMISKVAEVLALKRSFSINGIVTEEEIGEQKLQAQEAQQEVAQRKIKELTPQQDPTGGAVQHVTPNMIASNEYEQRHTALILEANAVLDESAREHVAEGPPPTLKPTRKRGTISFAALKQWKEIKDEILKLSGTTDLYYKALATGGYQHADEIKTQEDAAKIWKALKEITAELSKQKRDKALQLEIETHALRVGAFAFQAALHDNGLKCIEDTFGLDGNDLDGFLKQLRETV